jgi:hypothetical protein
VQQIPRTRPLVSARLRARRPQRPRDAGSLQRPPDGRVGMAGLAGDQPWPPAATSPGRADLLLLDLGQQSRHPVRTGRPILETTQRPTLLRRRFPPAPPPLARRRRRNAATPRRLPARTPRFDVADKRSPTSKSETRITVKGHPGPLSRREPWQTHSLEGGPDDLLSRPQPVEARQLAAGEHLPHEVPRHLCVLVEYACRA